MVAVMESGDYDGFFKLWEKNIPEPIRASDPTAKRLEFYLNIYFAVQPIHPSIPRLETVSE